MTRAQFDGTHYKTGQRHEWDSVADAWWKWWPVFERIGRQVSDRLVELADVQPGQRVLDVGTGSGCIAITVAVRLPGARVTATDISAAAIEVVVRHLEVSVPEHIGIGFEPFEAQA